jgi:GT2 family glycosyltransferase
MTDDRRSVGRVPRFSIVTPVHNPPLHLFDACLASVHRQTIGDWELCLVDDGSSAPDVLAALDAAVAADPRVRLLRRPVAGGIVAASNDGLAMADGEFVVLLDHDDTLSDDALALVDAVLRADPQVDYVYSDEAKVDEGGAVFDTFYKPDWSPERLRSQNYCTHLSVIRRSVVTGIGGFRDGFDGSQDHDLILRVGEVARAVAHVPQVLYHWCATAGSTAADADAKPYAREAGRRAVQEHLDRLGIPATVERLATPGHFVSRRRLPDPPASVSIVIPTAGTSGQVWGVDKPLVLRCLRSVLDLSTHPRFDVVVVIDPITPDPVRAALGRWASLDPRVRLVDGQGEFNFSARVNQGVAASSGEQVLLLNDDTEVVSPDWIETMAGFLLESDVGAVGAKLLYADGTLQHGGHLYSVHPLHTFRGYAGDDPGPFGLLEIDREVSGVTAACLLTPRSVWDELGGFDEAFRVAFNDVDYCLRVRDTDRRIIWTPHAVLHHFESQTRPGNATAEEDALLVERWAHVLDRDPYGNPNLAPAQAEWVPAHRTSTLAALRAKVAGWRAGASRPG